MKMTTIVASALRTAAGPRTNVATRARRGGALALLIAAGCLTTAGVARAADPAVPKFDYAKPPEKATDWKVLAKGGLVITTGNSQSRNGTLGVEASEQTGWNKVSLNGQIAYGRSNILVPVYDDPTAPTAIVGLDRQGQTTTNQWMTNGRYDRFFTPNNAGYASAQIGADKIAGKKLYGGGQVGYSRQLYKSDRNTLLAEAGYDLKYESYVQSPGKTIDGVTIHSARVFAGETFALTKETGFTGSAEALFNLNKEDALDASDTTGATKGVSAFKDTRVIVKAGMNTTIWKNISFGFGFTLKYDQNPAPRPVPGSAAAGLGYATDFQPFANKVDTLTEATLIVTFL